MFFNLRLKMIQFLIGKLSVVANATIDSEGRVLIGDGLALNNLFQTRPLHHIEFLTSHCQRLYRFPGSRVVEDHNAFLSPKHPSSIFIDPDADGSNPNIVSTLREAEELAEPGSTVYLPAEPIAEPMILTKSGLV